MIRILAALAALALAGCASTPADLEIPENAVSVRLDQPYQLTLKRVVEAEQNCRGAQLAPLGQQINDVQHYPDLREARIVQGASGIGTEIYNVLHIREVDGGTLMTLYTKSWRDERLARFERWARGDTACD